MTSTLVTIAEKLLREDCRGKPSAFMTPFLIATAVDWAAAMLNIKGPELQEGIDELSKRYGVTPLSYEDRAVTPIRRGPK
jgi:hypothetical protein